MVEGGRAVRGRIPRLPGGPRRDPGRRRRRARQRQVGVRRAGAARRRHRAVGAGRPPRHPMARGARLDLPGGADGGAGRRSGVRLPGGSRGVPAASHHPPRDVGARAADLRAVPDGPAATRRPGVRRRREHRYADRTGHRLDHAAVQPVCRGAEPACGVRLRPRARGVRERPMASASHRRPRVGSPGRALRHRNGQPLRVRRRSGSWRSPPPASPSPAGASTTHPDRHDLLRLPFVPVEQLEARGALVGAEGEAQDDVHRAPARSARPARRTS